MDENDSPVQLEQKVFAPKSVIVIHPGSKFLRIGRASDNSFTVLHAIARRRKEGGVAYSDYYQVPDLEDDEGLFAESYSNVLESISSMAPDFLSDDVDCRDADGVRIPYKNPMFCKNPPSDAEFIAGNEVMKIRLKHLEGFNIHFPWRRGSLNLHSGCGGSLDAVLTDLKDIWCYCLRSVVGILPEDIQKHRAVLVIPDIYNRVHVKLLVKMLLEDIGFSACLVVQDHVAATFGAGLPSACVVDVGDQKASISCVEDAMSLVQTRVRFGYGGGDVSALFLRCVQNGTSLGPLKDFDPCASIQNGLFTSQLKEAFCHADLNEDRYKDGTIVLPLLGEVNSRFNCSVQFGEERLVAGFAVFEPNLFHFTAPALARDFVVEQVPIKDNPDPEDPCDLSFLRDSKRRTGGSAFPSQFDDESGDFICASDTSWDPALHKAIIQSIEKCTSDDVKLKMYSTILLVGEGISQFKGIGNSLKTVLEPWIPDNVKAACPDAPEIVIPESQPQSGKPSAGTTVWKGAAIFVSLESAQDMWVFGSRNLVRSLKEKMPFIW